MRFEGLHNEYRAGARLLSIFKNGNCLKAPLFIEGENNNADINLYI